MATAKKAAALKLAGFPRTCKSRACAKAVLIADTAHGVCDALLSAYEVMRHQRGRPRGMTTDNEQDLLRSMLVMAAAGLDATVKQLVQDTLSHLVPIDSKAQNSFEKFALRRLSGDSTAGATLNARLLAAVLVSQSPRQRLLDEYVAHLTGSSLQSVDSLFEVAAALGSEPIQIGLIPAELKPIFDMRNKIIHELDIDLGARLRTRTVRSQTTMIRGTERVFRLAHAMIASVDGRLS